MPSNGPPSRVPEVEEGGEVQVEVEEEEGRWER